MTERDLAIFMMGAGFGGVVSAVWITATDMIRRARAASIPVREMQEESHAD